MRELERRIEDGIHYEHISNHYTTNTAGTYLGRRRNHHGKSTRVVEEDSEADNFSSTATASAAKAVFCGYRYTEDDYNRLKSAEIIDERCTGD
jgi:hypothetical protein